VAEGGFGGRDAVSDPAPRDVAAVPLSPAMTLPGLLALRAIQQPDQTAYRVIREPTFKEEAISYAELDRRMRAVASNLVALGLGGERLALLHHTGLEFLIGFFGALCAGCPVVPLSPPWTANAQDRLDAIVSDADVAAVLTTQSTHARLLRSGSNTAWPTRQRFIYTEDLFETAFGDVGLRQANPRGLAVIQYTSGSTSVPKGIELTHDNFLHNAGLMAAASGLTAESIGINWLPLFHDMGLMGGVIQPLFAGFTGTLIPPSAFLARPILWLQAMTRYRATVSGAPDFGYTHCVEMIGEEQAQGLDLSRWEVAYSGAEPVRADTIDRFVERFSPSGFRRQTFFPCYGLAEATLIVSGGPRERGPVVLEVSRRRLEENGMASLARDQRDMVRLVASGRPIADQSVIIVDPDHRAACGEGRVGEIWVKGRSVGGGYRNLRATTQDVFQARCDQDGDFLRTGDLGFLLDGQLFVVGRIKDVIIIRGVNHFPDDIELSVSQCHPALRGGGGAAFGLEIDGAEGLGIAHELGRKSHEREFSILLDRIRQTVLEQHGLSPAAIALMPYGSLPRTTSGKIQRYLARNAFMGRSPAPLAVWLEEQPSVQREFDSCGASDAVVEARITGLRALIMQIWLDVLHLEVVGLDDNFFDLGGQSAQLISVQLRLNKAARCEIPVIKLLQHPTIRSLSKCVAEMQHPPPADTSGQNDIFERSSSRRRFNRARFVQRRTAGQKDVIGRRGD
jgi:acyl-CoA synthetase (AMP-forming)/AMP-acid ligase II